ncbi:MAG: FAD-dependent oxidoreductase [Clostridia bacterium]|nr:FAD-dependent oxidoreductase [Clostridia bacterium]
MKSIWNENAERRSFSPLKGDINTDVLIIGGGMCGILCAYMLKNEGVDCVLVEADKICRGITMDTTAKLTLQHGLIYNKIMKRYGTEKAFLYYQSQKKALEKLKEISLKMDADLENSNSLVYSLNDREVIENEVLALNKLGCSAKFCEKTELPFDIAGAVKIENQANFHPLKFVFNISENLKIYENTKVIELGPDTAVTNRGKIKAKKIIVATHFPFLNKHGGFFIKMYQHRSYVLALKNAKTVKNMYVDEKDDGLSFRSYKDVLLLGGGGHRTGGKGGGWTELERIKKEYYPEAKIVTKWATQDCMTLDSIPYIGRYSKGTPDLYVATGFNKWGMTSSMVSAMLLSDMVQERKNDCEYLYSPQRSIIHPQLAVNVFESVKGLLTPTVPRCPHLGCALKYNKEEHSWDCPCHGSRFEEEGNLINNPATKDK